MQIRYANPSDASFLTQTILLAGRAHVKRGIWEVILGGTEEEVLSFLQCVACTRTTHLFHYSYYLIAEEIGSGPLGGLGGYNPDIAGYQALQKALPEVFNKLNLPESAFRDSSVIASKLLVCLPKTIAGEWVIDSVATLPEHRERNVAAMLLERTLGIGKKHGHSLAQVSIYIGNEPALNLYRKFGFKIVEENRDAYFEKEIGSPGMLSLARDL